MANIISDETIEYVGILAKLELNKEEKEQAKKDMGAMLDYIDKLNSFLSPFLPYSMLTSNTSELLTNRLWHLESTVFHGRRIRKGDRNEFNEFDCRGIRQKNKSKRSYGYRGCYSSFRCN